LFRFSMAHSAAFESRGTRAASFSRCVWSKRVDDRTSSFKRATIKFPLSHLIVASLFMARKFGPPYSCAFGLWTFHDVVTAIQIDRTRISTTHPSLVVKCPLHLLPKHPSVPSRAPSGSCSFFKPKVKSGGTSRETNVDGLACTVKLLRLHYPQHEALCSRYFDGPGQVDRAAEERSYPDWVCKRLALVLHSRPGAASQCTLTNRRKGTGRAQAGEGFS